MACKKCRQNKCRCKTLDLRSIPDPCSKPSCTPRRKCTEYINWNCVVIGDSGIILTNGSYTLYVPEGTSFDSFYQQQTLFAQCPTCLLQGYPCMSVKWFDAYFDGNNIIVEWQDIDTSLLQTGWQIDTYIIEITDLSTNTVYTFNAAQGSQIYIVTPVGSMTFTSGNMFKIMVKVRTNDSLNNIQICPSIVKQITI